MLVLTRKEGETLLIGDNIEIVIVSVNGAQVRIGTHAPADVEILRGELLAGETPDRLPLPTDEFEFD